MPGIPGIEVWKGNDKDGKLSFELLENSEQAFDILYVPISNGHTQIYVSVIDFPAIDDLDGDGDLDVLSFEPGGTKVTFYKNIEL